jgi:hypothetical protein
VGGGGGTSPEDSGGTVQQVDAGETRKMSRGRWGKRRGEVARGKCKQEALNHADRGAEGGTVKTRGGGGVGAQQKRRY